MTPKSPLAQAITLFPLLENVMHIVNTLTSKFEMLVTFGDATKCSLQRQMDLWIKSCYYVQSL
jgi:hypothetical protein